jgi:hypothetical protein
METATLQSRKQSSDCAATIYGNGDTTVAQTVLRLCCNHLWKRRHYSRTNSPPTVLQPFMETVDVKTALEGANIEKTTRSRALSVYGNGIC